MIKMKLGIMQPYFVPYMGYWQLMNAVDVFVVYDDVNFIKGGWINRNRICVEGQPKYFNIQMQGASPNKLIREVSVSHVPQLINKNLRMLENCYKKAPYFSYVYDLVDQMLHSEKDDIASFIMESFRIINDYLHIDTKLIMSSDIEKDNSRKGQEKVLDICSILHADEYYNTYAGKDLYSFEQFRDKGISLKFLRMNPIEYKQADHPFVENLSIIDVMMYNSPEKIREMLLDYTLIIE